MEERLKMDILEEAKLFDDNFLIHDESVDNIVVPCWEAVNEGILAYNIIYSIYILYNDIYIMILYIDSIQTPKEVYSELVKEGHNVSILLLFY
jgi:hypothetical protein